MTLTATLAAGLAAAAILAPATAAATPPAALRAAAPDAARQPARRPPSDEALEYLSLARAVAHAAREQRAQAVRAARPADRGAAHGWRIPAVAAALAALGLASLTVARVLARRHPVAGWRSVGSRR